MKISFLSENLFRYVVMYWDMVESKTPQKSAIDPSMRYASPLTVTPCGRLEDIVDKTCSAN